ncbi:hypothetical protein D9M73_227650 [compost metagenome]
MRSRSDGLAGSRFSAAIGAALNTGSSSRSCASRRLRSLRASHQRVAAPCTSSNRSRVILPVRSITLNQDKSVNTVKPNRNRAMHTSVLPCTFSRLRARSPRLSPRAPPAENGMLAGGWKWICASAAPDSTRNTRPINRQDNSQPLHSQG